MNWYKISQNVQQPLNLRFENDCVDAHDGQLDMFIKAYEIETKILVGYLQYVIYDNEISVQMVETAKQYFRRGIATRMFQFMQSQNPGMKVKPGMSTENGTPFVQSLRDRGILNNNSRQEVE